MRLSQIPTLALLLAGSAAFAQNPPYVGPAKVQAQKMINIVNESNTEIYSVKIRDDQHPSWSVNLLRGPIEPHKQVHLDMSGSSYQCRFEELVQTSSGQQIVLKDDMCDSSFVAQGNFDGSVSK